MKATFFKSLFDTSPTSVKDAPVFLDRIKNGKSRDIVDKLRQASNKDDADIIKKTLPIVCFGGEFLLRRNAELKKSSGLMILDFDKVDAKRTKDALKSDESIYAAWVSPSGNGVKALMRIHNVSSDDEYKFIWSQVKKKYNEIDESGKDICRACFESYDPCIYVNLDAKIFAVDYDDMPTIDRANIGSVCNIPIKDQDEIANRLMAWFKKKFNPNARNNSVFLLASAFNDFGVDRITAENYLFTFQEKDFSQVEIEKIITSAYKKSSQFGTKFFEDKKQTERLANMVLIGRPKEEIHFELIDHDRNAIDAEIEKANKAIDLNRFWEFNKFGQPEIIPYRLKAFLESNNYFKYYPHRQNKTFLFITKIKNFIDHVSEYNVKDFVMDNLIKDNHISVYNVLANRTSIFTPQYLSILGTADISIERDGVDFAMIYYKNNAIKVFKDKLEVYDYSELSGFVWEKQIIKRNFQDADHHESIFRSFIWYISGEEVDRYNTMKSIIGYLMHSYKTSANNRAIILNDETISDSPNGGSGKGIFITAIGYMKRVSTIDGKTFDFNKSFPYQTVSTDCQVLAFDDVKMNFEFERLFSLITEGITIEYKGKDAVRLPVTDSPKIVISTNYTIKSAGGSFERRMFEVELSSFFNANYTPYDHFGRMLFDDWDETEWARFDKYMINCLQYYLMNGLVKSEPKNLKLRKFINNTCQEFVDFVTDGNLKQGERYIKQDIFNQFHGENSELKFLTKRSFLRWVKLYADYDGLVYEDGNTNGKRWFEIGNKTPF